MLIRFKETFNLPIEDIFQYFRSPQAWPNLYGFPGKVKEYQDGWYAIPLRYFPFPLVARNVVCRPNEYVKWEFRGFWRGEGEIRFTSSQEGILVEGYEKISIRWLSLFSTIIEKLFLEKQFIYIWELGWKRLRKRAHTTAKTLTSV